MGKIQAAEIVVVTSASKINMREKMKISKVRDVKTPSRGTAGSAGIDFYIPDDFDTGPHYEFRRYVDISPGKSVKIPSGVHVKIPAEHVLIAFNKSSIASKNLVVGAQVIDEDYQGEIHIHIINVGNDVERLEAGQKITQFLLMPINYATLEMVDFEKLYDAPTERGEGGFGSTGAK